MARTIVLSVAAVLAAGCTVGSSAADDAGARDAASVDAPSVDHLVLDAPLPDAPPPDAPSDGTCASVRLDTRRTSPNVILVIDRSGSMSLDFDEGRSRWAVLREALIGTPDGLVTTLQSEVRFGVVMYSEDVEVPGCPDLATVPAALDDAVAITTQYTWNTPSGNTPTGETIQAILGDLDEHAPSRDEATYLVLATDGEPATCADGTDIASGRALSVEAVAAAYAMDIPTFVISVGTEIAMTHLQEVANAGAGHVAGEPDAPFWIATDTAGLRDALATIVTGVLSCEVELEGTIDPTRACDGTVTLGTDVLECETEWRATDATHIELLGSACDRLQRSTEELFASFPCAVIVI